MSRGADPTGWRIPADRLETLITEIVKQRLTETISRLEFAPYLKAYEIEDVIENFEPRCRLVSVRAIPDFDKNIYNVTIEFYVVNAPTELVDLSIMLERIR